MTDPRAMDHPDLTPLIDEFGPAPSPERRATLLRHVSACERCRCELARSEPSALFGLLALDPVPADVLARLDRGLAEQLDGVRPRGTRRRVRAWAGLAASFVLAASFGTYVVTRDPVTPDVTRGIAHEITASPEEGGHGVPPLELISSPGSARVLDLTVGEVDLVMIFDETLQL